jgi:hypothetical protein
MGDTDTDTDTVAVLLLLFTRDGRDNRIDQFL